MIDTVTIILSTTICLFILFRAILLDGRLDWFGKHEASAADLTSTAWSPAWDEAARGPTGASAALADEPHRRRDGRRA